MATQQAEQLPASSFDFANWRLDTARTVSACCVLAFAAAAWAHGGVWRVAAALLVLDVAIQILPWRLPRAERSVRSILVEEALYVVVPTAFLAVAAVQADWITSTPAGWWFAVAGVVGAGLVWAGGMPIRALLSGDLAFLTSALRRPHKWARVANIAVAPPGEEALFRGIVLAASGATAIPIGLLAGAAFVARHHLPPGASARASTRVVVTQVVAASAFLALTAASGSIYPALLAHYVNNAPSLLLEMQRRTES